MNMLDVYTQIASSLQAYFNCLEHEKRTGQKHDWTEKHKDRFEKLVSENMPSGSGFDSGTYLDVEKSRFGKLVFKTSFHHMNENGVYDGWTDQWMDGSYGYCNSYIQLI